MLDKLWKSIKETPLTPKANRSARMGQYRQLAKRYDNQTPASQVVFKPVRDQVDIAPKTIGDSRIRELEKASQLDAVEAVELAQLRQAKALQNTGKFPENSSLDELRNLQELREQFFTLPKEATSALASRSTTSLASIRSNRVRMLPVAELLGSQLEASSFEQRDSKSCQGLALLDNLLQHPLSAQLLGTIQIAKLPAGYAVKFPVQKQFAEVTFRDLKEQQIVQSVKPGVPVLMNAVIRFLPKIKPNEFWESADVLDSMFLSKDLPQIEPFNWNVNRAAYGAQNKAHANASQSARPRANRDSISPAEYKQKLQHLIQQATRKNADPKKIPLTLALQSGHEHIVSVRLLESTSDTIMIRDPRSSTTEPVPIDDFVKHYQLIGLGGANVQRGKESLRNGLVSDMKDTLRLQRKFYDNNPHNLKNLGHILQEDPELCAQCYQHDPELVNWALDAVNE